MSFLQMGIHPALLSALCGCVVPSTHPARARENGALVPAATILLQLGTCPGLPQRTQQCPVTERGRHLLALDGAGHLHMRSPPTPTGLAHCSGALALLQHHQALLDVRLLRWRGP